MKKILFALLLVLFMAVPAFAASLVWDASSGTVDGYIVYFGPTAGDHTANHYNVGTSTTCDINLLNLVPGVEYTFTVRAYNSVGESGDSNAVPYTRPAYSPPADALPTAVDIPGAPSGLIQS